MTGIDTDLSVKASRVHKLDKGSLYGITKPGCNCVQECNAFCCFMNFEALPKGG